MKAWCWAVTAFLLVACKDTPESKVAVENKTPAVPATPPKAAEQADADPDYTHVDREQLAALCLAANMPPVTIPSDYGVLSLADGSRVPWLTVWVDEEQAAALEQPLVPAKAWTQRANEYLKDRVSTFESPPPPTPRTGREWKRMPCDGSEVFSVVITGVFFEKKSFHVIAIRGKKLAQQELPTTTSREAVFRAAFELTEKLVGQSATIATHKFFGSGEQPKAVSTEAWVNAASKSGTK